MSKRYFNAGHIFALAFICLCFGAIVPIYAAEETTTVEDGFVSFANSHVDATTEMHIEIRNNNDGDFTVAADHALFIMLPSVMGEIFKDVQCSYGIGDENFQQSRAALFTATDVMIDADGDEKTQVIQLHNAQPLVVPTKGSFHIWCTNMHLPQHEVSADWIADNMSQASFGIAVVNPNDEDADPLLEEYLAMPPVFGDAPEAIEQDQDTFILTMQGTSKKNHIKVKSKELKALCAAIESSIKHKVGCRAVDGSFDSNVLYVTFILPTNSQVGVDQMRSVLEKKSKSLARFANDMFGLHDVEFSLNSMALPRSIPKISYVPTNPEELQKQRQASEERFRGVLDRLGQLVGRPAAVGA